MKTYLELFLAFLKIGAFTFGGGYAMIPLIEKEVVIHKKWVHKDEIMNLFSIAQSIPGAIAINTSTLIGYKVAGRRGAIAATSGVILPSFIIIISIATFFGMIADAPAVKAVFIGINGAVVALILVAAKKMIKGAVVDGVTLMIFIVTVLCVTFTNLSPIWFIILGGILGFISYRQIRERKKSL
ncbi:chromate transporter [Petrocella sp. FN5]|uniref:chromate transporter n=1 Tax=Petrocella sp. FN5 TaxID=3032002 RepID=UPI0023D9D650|nr:chromate transporter [Petrocella sp. FN5]MDF1616498.1 chromate transporter [Petrocella sp. FN5]